MTDIKDEFEELQKQQKRVSIFKQKSEKLSRLKLNFYNKMVKAEAAEDIEIAKQYYSYLIRTMKLSSNIYYKMEQEIISYSNHYSHQTLTPKEIDQSIGGTNIPEVNALKGVFQDFHTTAGRFQNELSAFFYEVAGNNSPVSNLRNIVSREETFFNDIENYHSDFFKKLDDQKQIHALLEEEEKISNEFIRRIEQLEKRTMNFIQRISQKIDAFKNSFYQLGRKLQQDPSLAAKIPAEKFAHLIEKHAGIIAATAIGLGLVANLSTLAGLATFAGAAKTTMELLSHSLEGVEAFPVLRNIASKTKTMVNQTINRVQMSMQNAFSQSTAQPV